MTKAGLLVVALALAAGCTSPSTPTPAPLRVTVEQNPTFSGDSLSFGTRVENISQAAVELTFPSACQILLEDFRDQRTGQLVTPADPEIVCPAVLVRRTLQPGEVMVESMLVKSGTGPNGPFFVLPPGQYTIQVRLDDEVFRTQSNRIAFALQ